MQQTDVAKAEMTAFDRVSYKIANAHVPS